ncbi:hypothetical protein HPB47_004407 [Ixodes persulcatus]|uniref:Uncharacterized protein n=1 Tax=Ixodes persulcatus TaxID=34615 RepID=A0AC60PFU2_IXOPE|nr:hypothetical protein HPB47_004407 [Ixodes persulcatus]
MGVRISLQLGTKLNLENIQESDDVYLNCRVNAYPAVEEASENLLVSKNFLVIQRVQTHHSGFYSCSAESAQGRTKGDTLQLPVQQQTNQELQYHGTRSVALYVPHSHTEYGRLLCTASNRIRKQKIPCLFHVVQADCPASGASCFSCGRAGHFANVCRSRPRGDHYQQQLAFRAGRRASVRNDYYQRRQAEPGPTGTPVRGITFPDYELPATICTVAPPDDFPERCRFCGGPCHQRKFCPAAHRRCFSCRKQGHLDRVCESRPRCLRLDRGGPSNPPTVFRSGHRRRRKMRHPLAPWSRPRGGTLPPEPPFPAAAPPAVPAAAPPAVPAAAPSAAALPAAPPTVPTEVVEPVPKENQSPETSPDNSWSSSTTNDSSTVLAPPPTAEARAAVAAPARQLCSRLGGSEARVLAYGSPCGGFESRPRLQPIRQLQISVIKTPGVFVASDRSVDCEMT